MSALNKELKALELDLEALELELKALEKHYYDEKIKFSIKKDWVLALLADSLRVGDLWADANGGLHWIYNIKNPNHQFLNNVFFISKLPNPGPEQFAGWENNREAITPNAFAEKFAHRFIENYFINE